MDRANVFFTFLLQEKESGDASDIFCSLTNIHRLTIEVFCTKYVKTFMSNSLELYDNCVCFVILTF